MSDFGQHSPADDLTTLHVRRAIDGDPDGVAWIVSRFSPLLKAQARYRVGNALKDRIDPDDLVSEAWLVALRKLPDVEERGGRYTPVLLKFLATTVRFVANNRIRSHLRANPEPDPHGASPTPLAEYPAEITDAVQRAARDEVAERVTQEIDRLDEASRTVVILRGVEGLSNQEVADLLGELPNTVSHRYRRALDRLREQLPRETFDALHDA